MAEKNKGWEEIRDGSKAQVEFERQGISYLKKLISETGLSNAAISRKMMGLADDIDKVRNRDIEIVGELIRKNNPKPVTRGVLETIAPVLFESLKGNPRYKGVTSHVLEANLSISFGLLPRHFQDFPSDLRQRLLEIWRGLINSAAYSISADQRADTELAKHWLTSVASQMAVLEALTSFTQSWRDATEWDQIEKIWQTIERSNWQQMQPEQKAWAAILRAEILKLRGLSHDALAFLEFAQMQFPDEFVETKDSPTRLIRYRMYSVWGDTYRELGFDSDAIHAYENAMRYANPRYPIEEFRLRRKKFNALVRVGKIKNIPDLTYLREAIDTGQISNTGEILASADFARTSHALAWYYRTKGLADIDRSKRYLEDAFDRLEQDKETVRNAHVRAVGEQYYLETLLRAGEFKTASSRIKGITKEPFPKPHYARRAFSELIYSRIYFYSAMGQGGPNALSEILRSIEHLEQADTLFSLMGTNPRRAQVLIELAKFRAFLLAFSGGPVDNIDLANSHLALAQTILNTLGTFKEHIQSAIDINSSIVHFVQLKMMRSSEMKAIKDILGTINKVKKSELQLTDNLHETSSGHEARTHALFAISEIVTLRRNTLTERIKEEIKQSALKSMKQDYMAMLDCRWLISFATNNIELQRQALEIFDKGSDYLIRSAPTGSWIKN